MPMKIEGLENINSMLSVFHDGEINHAVKSNSCLKFDVNIQYLAERINPEFLAFSVILEGIESLTFTTWPDEKDEEPEIFTDINSIFTKDLGILSGEIENESIKLACNQPIPGLGYCGGFLSLKANSAIVKDEAGKEYSIDELISLSSDYWDEWSKNKKA